MTSSAFAVEESNAARPGRGPGRGRGRAQTITIGVIASVTVLGLLVAGVTFGALALAFAIAIPIAEQYHVSVSASDMAVARQIAGYSWVFVAVAVASFVAAAVVIVKSVGYLDSAPRADSQSSPTGADAVRSAPASAPEPHRARRAAAELLTDGAQELVDLVFDR